MSAATDDPTGVAIPSDHTYISHREAKEWEAEIQSMEQTLADPRARLEDRGEVVQQLRRAKASLEQQSPPDVTPEQKDRIAREAKALLEKISAQMCSSEEMRKAPPGAIGKHFKERELIPDHIRWKNMMRILHKGDPDPDVSNLEVHRPRTSTLNMDNAFIPGKDYYIPPNTPQYKENWERTFGKNGGSNGGADIDALKQRIEDLSKRLENLAVPPGRPTQLRKKMEPADSLCGKTFKSKAGVSGHERSCPKCAEMRSGGVTT